LQLVGQLVIVKALQTAHLHVARPERQVVTKQLHDERTVLVALLAQRIKFGYGFIEGLLSTDQRRE
jgi:hypothetical protein